MLIGICSGAAWFLVFLIAHTLLFHARPIRNRFKAIARIYLASLIGHAITIGLVVMLFAGDRLHRNSTAWVALIAGSLVMACLFVLYMPFFFTVGTSLSIQTMILVEHSAERRAPVRELQAVFASKNLVAGRLETMVANGYLIRDGDCYRVSAKGRLVAGVFGVLKRAWRLGAGG